MLRKQAPSLSVDTAPLESFSSFRVIREASQSVSHSEGSDKARRSRRCRPLGGPEATKRPREHRGQASIRHFER